MHFIYLTFSIITPFVLGLLLVMGMKYNISKEVKFCTTKVTKLQSDHRTLTKRLIDKNSYAATLRVAREAAEEAVKVDPTKISLAALTAGVLLHGLLRTYQQGLILAANIQYGRLQVLMLSKGYFPKKGNTGLSVSSYPKGSDSPSYRLESSYQDKKSIEFIKILDSKKNFHFLIKKIKGINRFFKFTCGATLTKKGGLPSDIKLLLGK